MLSFCQLSVLSNSQASCRMFPRCRRFKNDVELLRTMRCDIHGRYRLGCEKLRSPGFRHLFFLSFFILLIVLMVSFWTILHPKTRKCLSMQLSDFFPYHTLLRSLPLSPISIPALFDSTRHAIPANVNSASALPIYYYCAATPGLSPPTCCLVHSCFDVNMLEQSCFLIPSWSDVPE